MPKFSLPAIIGSSLLAAGIVALAPTNASAITMFTLEGNDNFGSDPVKVKFTLEDLGDDIKFTVDVLPEDNTGNIGDLRGIFFDILDDSLLPGLSVTGADVTNQVFSANNVINLGQGANLNGDGNKNFDAGVRFGTPGIGSDDIRSTMFILDHVSQSLDLAMFDAQTFGARLTSVGPEGSGRGGSSKIKGVPPTEPPTEKVPEPAAMAGLAVVALAGAIKRRQAR